MNCYEHKHEINVTDHTIDEFGSGFCRQCGEIIEDTTQITVDKKLIDGLKEVQLELSNLQSKIVENTPPVIVEMQQELSKLQDRDALLRSELKKAMAASSVKKFDNEWVTVAYVAPTTRVGFDSAKFKKERPEIYKQYEKRSDVSDSIRITIKQPKGE